MKKIRRFNLEQFVLILSLFICLLLIIGFTLFMIKIWDNI